MVDYVASDGVRLNVAIAGPDAAPTVVLVHGLAASIDLGWRATGVLERLAADRLGRPHARRASGGNPGG